MAISMTGNGTGLEPFLALVLLLLHFSIVDSLQLCRAEFHPQRVDDRAINLVTVHKPPSRITLLYRSHKSRLGHNGQRSTAALHNCPSLSSS